MEKTKQLICAELNDFKEVFRRYFQPLCHLSQHYLENEDEAREVVQEAFVKLWEIRNNLPPDSNLGNFLFTVVKNTCLNILKRRQILLKHHEIIRAKELHFQYESLKRIGDDFLEFKELKAKIERAVQNLPEQCRIVFEMSRNEELKNQEIAQKLGISQKTVEAHLTKALKILRKDLKDYLPLLGIITEILN